MVIARTNDACVEGFSPQSRLRFLYADVTETAAQLQLQHESCILSSLILARLLAGIALLGVDLSDQEEILSLHAETNGAIQGFAVEMTGRGGLRGYTENKAITRNPVRPLDVPNQPYGTQGRVKITRRHLSGAIRSQMSFQVSPVSERLIFMEFYNASMQIPTEICLHASLFNNRIERARGLAVQLMPDGRKSEFRRIVPYFHDGSVQEQLEYDATVASLVDLFDLPDLMTGPTRALALQCSCSQAIAEQSFASRSPSELAALARLNQPQSFRCHLCGSQYTISPQSLQLFATSKS